MATKKKWSQRVTQTSNAFDLEMGVFTWEDTRKIALSLKRSADSSIRRKSEPFRSAMSRGSKPRRTSCTGYTVKNNFTS